MAIRTGKIRLVNPDRGCSIVAEIESLFGLLSARTKDCRSFAFYFVTEGKEFYCGREFSRAELLQFTREAFTHPQQRTKGWLGEIPATGKPYRWTWRAIGPWGEARVKKSCQPAPDEIRDLAEAALALEPGADYPILDVFECWVCDKEKLLPIALVLCAPTQEEVETWTYSPMARLGCGDHSFDFETCYGETYALQKRINDRINTAPDYRRFGFFARVFRRHADGSATEFSPDGSKVERKVGYLPAGMLAEPFETEFNELKALEAMAAA